MNLECKQLERRVISGTPLTDELREHASDCERCELTLSLPTRIERERSSRHSSPAPGFASRSLAAAIDRVPRRRARRRRMIGAGLAATAAAVAMLAWQVSASRSVDIEIAAVDIDADLEPIDRPGRIPAPTELELDLKSLSNMFRLTMDWARVSKVMSELGVRSVAHLSKAETAGVQATVDRANKTTFEIIARLRSRELALRRELEKDPPSWSRVDRVLGEIGDLERQLRRARIGAWVVVRTIAAGVTPPAIPSPPASPSSPTPPAAPAAPSTPSAPEACDEVTCLVDPSLSCCPRPRPPAPPAVPAVVLPDRPKKSDVRRGIARIRKLVGACERSGFTGKLRVKLRILKDGRGFADLTTQVPADFDRCVRRMFRTFRFPRSKNGITVTIPLSIGGPSTK